jgi:hypothetical protein
MASVIRLSALFILLTFSVGAQIKKTTTQKSHVKKAAPAAPVVVRKPVAAWTQLGLGIGRSRSALFLGRNTKQDNDARGWTANAVYGITQVVRLSVMYTWYKPIDIAPTWYNVRAHTLEVNLNFRSMMVNANACFYPIVGISYNVFQGRFTGLYDYLNLRALYEPNTDVVTRWLGLNAGVGMEQYIRKVGIFGEFRMRVGVSEGYNQLTVMDVCLSAGVRYHFKVHSLHRIFNGTRSRYVLDTHDEG